MKHQSDHISVLKGVEKFSLNFFLQILSLTRSLFVLTDCNHIVFMLQILDYHQFYLALDNEFLADRIKSLVGFLGANWRRLGRPILTMIITHSMLGRLLWQLIWHLAPTMMSVKSSGFPSLVDLVWKSHLAVNRVDFAQLVLCICRQAVFHGSLIDFVGYRRLL